MKLNLDPMPALRTGAESQINSRFNVISGDNLHRDQAHAQKRAEAAAVLAGSTAIAPEFLAEAQLRGVSALDLANTILSKPNAAAGRELSRQQIMLQIAAINKPADLVVLLATANLSLAEESILTYYHDMR